MATFFDHSRHRLHVFYQDAEFDVLAFHGEEQLSQPFTYRIEFTSTQKDIPAEQLLNHRASFSLWPVAKRKPNWLPATPDEPLRTFYGVITGLQRLSGSRDETRYEVTLQPRLARLANGQQYRLYQHRSVPQIVESILRSRHDMQGQDFLFSLSREYPPREQVMQYGESDLAFISRLLAEVGIWYRLASDERLKIEVIEFHDSQRDYQFDVTLPYRPPGGLNGNAQEAVWQLQTRHRVVEQNVSVRSYHDLDARALLDAQIDRTRGASTLYGETYQFGDGYRELGDRYAFEHQVQSESGYFYARLRHERHLNEHTRLSGSSNSATLAPGQVLNITDGAPQAFARGALITGLSTRAARDRSLECQFEALPYAEDLCFRPPLLPKPQIAGSVPARVTSNQADDPYGHIDPHGRYKVNFLFDRDTWKLGQESLWLRLARPYAGDTHGLHLPLLAGTEVAVAFEQGDPDRPYIAHALHDNRHPDPVTLDNYKRNVLRTPANNKLRMEDQRGQEHIKLSTDYAGKSQLNLGHLVDSQRRKRGEGFELRTDGWGVLRAGKGVFISADEQVRGEGELLDMAAAVDRLQRAGEQMEDLSASAQECQADPADVQAQMKLLREDLEHLKSSVLLLSAPQGIALTSGRHLQLAAQRNLQVNAGAQADVSVVKQLFIGAGQGLSVFVRKLGIKLIANQGAVRVQAQNDRLELLARHGLDITSTEDEIHITAKKRITLNAGGSYLRLDACCIESGTEGDYKIKAADYAYTGPASLKPAHPEFPLSQSKQKLRITVGAAGNAQSHGWAGMPYTLYADGAEVQRGVLDATGNVLVDHQVVTRAYRLVMASGTTYHLPVAFDYRNAEQGIPANQGLQRHYPASPNGILATLADPRALYAQVLETPQSQEEIPE